MDNIGHMGPLMTLAEVSDYLKVSEKTVVRMLQDGDFPGFKVSNQWRFHMDDIGTWLQVRREESAPTLAEESGNPPDEKMIFSLKNLTSEEWILCGLPVMRMEDALVSMANRLVDNRIVGDVADFVDGLLAREHMAPTSLGRGVAIPHLRDPDHFPVDKPLMLVATFPGGIEWEAPDRERVRLVLLPIAGNVTAHLRILAATGGFLKKNDRLIDHLVAAKSAKAVYSLLLQDEQQELS